MTRQRAQRNPFDEEPGIGALFGAILAGLLKTFLVRPLAAALRGAGRLISAHPSVAGGTAAFAVIFGFVSANALWYQPGHHPAPILKTRETATAAIPPLAAVDPVAAEIASAAMPVRTVTTYRIQRNDETPTASIPVPRDEPVPMAALTPTPESARNPAPAPAADATLAAIQSELAALGLYGDDIDGLMGPKSEAAIRAWENQAGLEETGRPSHALLAAMRGAGGDALASPTPVSAPNPTPRPAPAARAGDDEPVTLPATAETGSDLVRRIQSGLSNIAYADITVDGVSGAETRAAIRAFERHYRLPETGEPNDMVLEKLLEIGAL